MNILVIGTDSRSDEGVSDNSLRTDTMLLLTVDIQNCKAAMFSFPRNMCTPGHHRQLWAGRQRITLSGLPAHPATARECRRISQRRIS